MGLADSRAPERAPSRNRQIDYIVDNARILDYKAKKAILDLVMMEVVQSENEAEDDAGAEENQAFGRVILLCVQKGEDIVDGIVLDNIENPKVIEHIYNIVRIRRESLNDVPAQ